jgi:predicted ABC-type ATPase
MALRERVATDIYGDGALNKDRQAWIVTGQPASGKNTAVADPLVSEHGAMMIDNDEMKQALPEYGTGLGAAAVHEEASSIIGPEVLARAVENGDNIVMPRVGKDYDGLADDVRLLKAAGYKVNMVYVHVDEDVALQRATRRFQRTGRLVPMSYIRSVDGHPARTFERMKSSGLADSYSKYDNNGGKGQARKVE